MPSVIDSPVTLDDLTKQVADLRAELEAVRNGSLPEDKLSMVVFSGDLDKLLAAFVIATGSAAMFDEVVMFFTFWGTMALRDPHKNRDGKDFMSKMFGWMLPKGASALSLSKMHMGGAGTAMMKSLMKKKNVFALEELIGKAAKSGVKIYVCEMSMDLMGFSLDEMIDYPGIKLAGVGTFLQDAGTSKSTLFI